MDSMHKFTWREDPDDSHQLYNVMASSAAHAVVSGTLFYFCHQEHEEISARIPASMRAPLEFDTSSLISVFLHHPCQDLLV